MGYRIQYGGELTITPPLTESEHDRLLALCKLDNPRTKDVFAGVSHPTADDLTILGHRQPWDEVLFYEWYLGPSRNEDHAPGECWTLNPPDESTRTCADDVVSDLSFLYAWLRANGHYLAGELSWSGDSDDDKGTIYVESPHGVEAVEDIHDNPGPSWLWSAAELTPIHIPFSPSPGCGHSSQYAYTEDGGKHIVCLLCERDERKQAALLEQAEGRADRRKLYVIEFLYADNNQLFQTFAHLTEPESKQVQGYLERLKEYGEIEGLGDQGSGDFVGEWSIKPHPSMAELVKEFANNDSFAGAREDGITLEVANVNNTV